MSNNLSIKLPSEIIHGKSKLFEFSFSIKQHDVCEIINHEVDAETVYCAFDVNQIKPLLLRFQC